MTVITDKKEGRKGRNLLYDFKDLLTLLILEKIPGETTRIIPKIANTMINTIRIVITAINTDIDKHLRLSKYCEPIEDAPNCRHPFG